MNSNEAGEAVGQGAQDAVGAGTPPDRRIQEQRRYERLKAGLSIQYHPLNRDEETLLEQQGHYVPLAQLKSNTAETRDLNKLANEAGAVSEDISLGGLKLHSPQALEPGARLWLEIVLPDVPIPVNATAEVRWCQPDPERTGHFNSGLRFIGISKNDLDKVERFLVLQKKAQFEKRS